MTDKESSIMGKYVNDMYGSRVGKAIGTTTDIDGTVVTVGIDCGYRGLMEIPFEHLVVQEDSIVYVPQWRLDSQKILREKGLIIRRLRALHIILSENDRMKPDSEAVRRGYEEKLASINESEYTMREMLAARMSELADQMKVAKSLRFDATIQFKSNEMQESDYKVARASIVDMLERIEYEIGEIKNMQGRLEELADEESQIYDSVQTGERLDQAEQTEAVSEAIPEPPTETFEPTVQEPAIPEPAAAAPEQAPTPAVFADAAPEIQTETVPDAVAAAPEQAPTPAVFADAAPEIQTETVPDAVAAAPEQAPTPAVFADAAPEQAAERGGPQEIQREPVTIPPEPVAVPPGTPVPPPAPEYNIPEPPPEPPKSDWLARMTSQ